MPLVIVPIKSIKTEPRVTKDSDFAFCVHIQSLANIRSATNVARGQPIITRYAPASIVTFVQDTGRGQEAS